MADAMTLYRRHSVEELASMAAEIREEPANLDPGYGHGGLYLYTPAARRKLEAIGWAIYYHQQHGPATPEEMDRG